MCVCVCVMVKMMAGMIIRDYQKRMIVWWLFDPGAHCW